MKQKNIEFIIIKKKIRECITSFYLQMTFTEYPYNNLRNRFGAHLTDKGFDLLNR